MRGIALILAAPLACLAGSGSPITTIQYYP